jgi:hypothetical protein
MTLESAQILCSAVYLNRGVRIDGLYKPTHLKHPCVQWAAASHVNFMWLLAHAYALAGEYTARFGKVHGSFRVIEHTGQYAHYFPVSECSHPYQPAAHVLAMPDVYKCDDPVEAYRNYYIHEKAQFARWSRGRKPEWWPSDLELLARAETSLQQAS